MAKERNGNSNVYFNSSLSQGDMHPIPFLIVPACGRPWPLDCTVQLSTQQACNTCLCQVKTTCWGKQESVLLPSLPFFLLSDRWGSGFLQAVNY